MDHLISVKRLTKRYNSSAMVLNEVDLEIRAGEIFALLGPNGAGKSTLISILSGTLMATSGQILIDGIDLASEPRRAKRNIGLVPQQLTVHAFATVLQTVHFTLGLFNLPVRDDDVHEVLSALSLWEKKDTVIRELSGGMKRRVMIAKALIHRPKVLFLDEPTAGVDVALRRDLWDMVKRLRDTGLTILLTTHYIEEAEDLADRVGVIHDGRIVRSQDKTRLMQNFGHRELIVDLDVPLEQLPQALSDLPLELVNLGDRIILKTSYSDHRSIFSAVRRFQEEGLQIKDLITKQSSLEDVLMKMLEEDRT